MERTAQRGPASVAPGDDAVGQLRAVADAVLYEGYLLYPYRRSSPKNRVRWQFGVLTPREWAERDGPVTPGVSGSVDSWYQQTECLLLASPEAVVRVGVRYLQLQRKQVERLEPDGGRRPVESLRTGDTVHLTFDEAVPCEALVEVPLARLLEAEHRTAVGSPAGESTEAVGDGAGLVVRRRDPVEAVTVLRAERVEGGAAGPPAYRLRVRTENTGPSPATTVSRAQALRHSLMATHTLIEGDGVEFLSLIDPPEAYERHARECRNLHTFPVLGGARAVLSAPIILSDHPQVAPESPGDLHDAAEIDEILTLRTLLLTDEEKREARATDQRAADILDRVESLPREVVSRLHGAIRSLDPVPSEVRSPARAAPRASVPWWHERRTDGLSPTTDSVLVGDVPVAAGSAVRLRPAGRGADAQDMFLAGRTARVAAVFQDVDGGTHLAVTLDDDPAAELNSWYGRYFYFRPHELQPLTATATATAAEGGCDGRP
ncbi:hypothetical protein [Streptomyces sp. NPDC006739]|uniref:hypothetical protein n=1 Tax=Streptomyces sp. NPDC006739 TaxID=3364763 RepID=UPI00368F705F